MKTTVARVALVLLAAAGCGGGASSSRVTVFDFAIACEAPSIVCGAACTDPRKDFYHCGGCGKECDPGSVCSDGTCKLHCPAGETSCAGSCIDLASDSAHCG